ARPDLNATINAAISAFGQYTNFMAAGMFVPVGTRTLPQLAAAATAALGTTDGVSATPAQFGSRLYAALEAPDGTVDRFTFDPADGINHFLRADTTYRLSVFDPTTLKVGATLFTSAPSGAKTQIPVVGMAADLGTPLADGLTSTAAFVVGVNPDKRDNLVPGM